MFPLRQVPEELQFHMGWKAYEYRFPEEPLRSPQVFLPVFYEYDVPRPQWESGGSACSLQEPPRLPEESVL